MPVIVDGSKVPTAGYVTVADGVGFDFSNAIQIDSVNTSIGVGGEAPIATAQQVFAAGTTSKAPAKLTYANALLATPEQGAVEFNGNLVFTNEIVQGQGYIPSKLVHRLTADSGAKGPAIADYFSYAANVAAATTYEFVFYLWFLKTTAGTVTFTIASSQAPVNLNGILQIGAIAGGTAVGAANQIAITGSTSAAAAFGATGSLTTGVNHAAIIRLLYTSHATLDGDVRLRVTSSAGTVTPREGSYFEATRLPTNDTGNFTIYFG